VNVQWSSCTLPSIQQPLFFFFLLPSHFRIDGTAGGRHSQLVKPATTSWSALCRAKVD
jgi:hypothetical protein